MMEITDRKHQYDRWVNRLYNKDLGNVYPIDERQQQCFSSKTRKHQ